MAYILFIFVPPRKPAGSGGPDPTKSVNSEVAWTAATCPKADPSAVAHFPFGQARRARAASIWRTVSSGCSTSMMSLVNSSLSTVMTIAFSGLARHRDAETEGGRELADCPADRVHS